MATTPAKATAKREFASGIGHETMAFACVVVLLCALAMRQDPEASCSGALGCTLQMLRDREYHVRCAISLPIAVAIWFACALFASATFPRKVVARGARPPTFSLRRLDSDAIVTLVGLVSGTPMIQLFHHASDKFGPASGMLLYKDPLALGPAWAVLQVPVYLLLWDLTFYVLHRWVLHHPALYGLLHSGHHTFRPPADPT